MRHTFRLWAFLAVAAIALLATQPGGARADVTFRDVLGAVVTGVAGLAVESALDRSESGSKDHFLPGENYIDPQRYTKSDEYELAFSPTRGVFCYPKQELCFGSDGGISRDWTHSIYNK